MLDVGGRVGTLGKADHQMQGKVRGGEGGSA